MSEFSPGELALLRRAITCYLQTERGVMLSARQREDESLKEECKQRIESLTALSFRVSNATLSPKLQQTCCSNCGGVLTNDQGHRLESAYFDSSLPSPPAIRTGVLGELETIWARCFGCVQAAREAIDERERRKV